MLTAIKHHFRSIDPIHEHRWFVVKFFIVLCFGLWMFVYTDRPERIYFMLAPIATEISGFFFYPLKQKFIAKCLMLLVMSVSIMFFISTNQLGFILAMMVFVLVFGFMLFAYFSPFYRAVVAISMCFAVPGLIYTGGWYAGVSACINVAIVVVFSMCVEVIFQPVTKHYVKNGYSAIFNVYIERLELCIESLKKQELLSVEKTKQLYHRDFVARQKTLNLIEINRANPGTFNTLLHSYTVRLSIIATRQSLIGVIMATNYLIKYSHKIDQSYIDSLMDAKQTLENLRDSIITEEEVKPDLCIKWQDYFNKENVNDKQLSPEMGLVMKAFMTDLQSVVESLNMGESHDVYSNL